MEQLSKGNFDFDSPFANLRLTNTRRTPRAYVVGSSFNLLVEFVLIFIPERGISHEQDVENDPWQRKRRQDCSRLQTKQSFVVNDVWEHFSRAANKLVTGGRGDSPQAHMSTGFP